MGCRIWYQSFIELDTVPDYRTMLERHLRVVAGPDTEVVIYGMAPGTYRGTTPAYVARHAYLMYLHTNQLIDNARRAEREGYDAVVLGIIQDPGLQEMRTVVDIPVVGYGEAAMHLACMLGRRFSILAFNPDFFPLLEDNISKYGLAARLGSLIPIDIDYVTVTRGFSEPQPVVDAFQRAAIVAIGGGADVLIPGQMILAEVLWQHGVHRIQDVPVIDALGAVIMMAELLIRLKHQSGVWHARRGYWGMRPSADVVAEARSLYLRERNAGYGGTPHPAL